MKFKFAEAKVTTSLFAAVVVTGLLVGGIARIADTQYELASTLAKSDTQHTTTAKVKIRNGVRSA